MSVVYVVVMDEGGMFGVWYDVERARGAAKAINGVVVELPILEDYRATPKDAPRTEADPCGCWRQYDRHSVGPVATYTCRAHMEPDPEEQQP